MQEQFALRQGAPQMRFDFKASVSGTAQAGRVKIVGTALFGQGWQQGDKRPDYPRYVNVIGGFLSATVDRAAGAPTLTFRFHDVDGKALFSDAVLGR